MWIYLAFFLFVCFYNIDISVTSETLADAQNSALGFLIRAFSNNHMTALQVIIDIILIFQITVATMFLMPVSLLLFSHSLNFLAGQSTPERIKQQGVIANGALGEAIKGKDYAKIAMLNMSENSHLFISNKSMQDF